MTKEPTRKEPNLSEGQAVNLVRNALLVAGHEMGEDGDHWPVIKSTIHQMMQDYEQLKIERNVDDELKVHLGEQLAIMESRVKECPVEIRAQQMRLLREMREVYEAYFASIDEDQIVVMEDDVPDYIKQAEEIILTLEEDDA
jgi:predicted exporter